MKLIATNLGIRRGARMVVQGCSFAVAAGEALLLTGPNGAGKTTLLRALAGLLPVAEGTLALENGGPAGDAAGAAEAEIGEQCHYVGHLNALKARLTCAENLRFWAQFLGGGAGAAGHIDAALDQLGLASLAGIPAGYLSAGQKRRLGLARLLVAQRPLWLLDEPTASLDRSSGELFSALVTRHLAEGGLAVIATHLPLGFASARELALGGAR